MGTAARGAHKAAPGDMDALRIAVEDAWPSAPALRTPDALVRWTAFNWLSNNLLGLQGMAEREARDA